MPKSVQLKLKLLEIHEEDHHHHNDQLAQDTEVKGETPETNLQSGRHFGYSSFIYLRINIHM